MQYDEVIARLKAEANPDNVAGMARYGISTTNTLGISIFTLRKFAKEIKKDHELALKLWDSGIHEARILASFIEEPEKMTEAQLESWVKDFDSWDVVDQVSELISKTPGPAARQSSSRELPFPSSPRFLGMIKKSPMTSSSNSLYLSKMLPLTSAIT